LSTHEKLALIVEQSWTSRTAKSAHGVACTSLRRLGHPVRDLGWVPGIIFLFFSFSLIDHPLGLVTVLNLKFPPTECIHIQLISNLAHSQVNKTKQHYRHIHMCICHGVDFQVVQWLVIVQCAMTYDLNIPMTIRPCVPADQGFARCLPTCVPCSGVSISIFIRFYASCEYTHTKSRFIEKNFTFLSIPSKWTRAHLCMCTPRLFNPNKQNTCEQVNAKQSTYLCLHTNPYKMCIKQYKYT